jgi:hypothetical protein
MTRIQNLSSIRASLAAACLAGICLSTASAAAPATDTPLAVVGALSITQKDLDAALDSSVRKATLRRLVLQALVDAQANQLGITITDQAVDAGLAQWKAATFGGDDVQYQAYLDEQGISPEVHRQVFRTGLLATAIIQKTTRLNDSDYDKLEVKRFYVPNAAQAQRLYDVLSHGGTLNGAGVKMEILPTMLLLRYDQKLDAKFLAHLFTLGPGRYAGPIPSLTGQGYEVLLTTKRYAGSSMTTADRQVWARFLLEQKCKDVLPEWWAALDTQVDALLAASATR